MITKINQAKPLMKHIWCGCKCTFDCRKYDYIKSGMNLSRCTCTNSIKYSKCKQCYIWNFIDMSDIVK